LNAGCATKVRRKICPQLTETGPIGHVEDFSVDLELKAMRLAVYARDVLIREYVMPFDKEIPYWGFNEKFVMVCTPRPLQTFNYHFVVQVMQSVLGCVCVCVFEL